MKTTNMSPDQKDKILADMRAKQRKKEELEHRNVQASGEPNTAGTNDEELKRLRQQVAQLQDKVLDAKEQADSYKNQYENLKQEQDSEKNERLLNKVLGSNKRMFVKEYTLDVEDAKPEKIMIKMRYPSALDLTRVEHEYETLTGTSLADYASTRAQNIMLGIAYFRTVGEEVPKWLTDPELLERWDMVSIIISDYLDWVDTFQKTVTQ